MTHSDTICDIIKIFHLVILFFFDIFTKPISKTMTKDKVGRSNKVYSYYTSHKHKN